MTELDQQRWDDKYMARKADAPVVPAPPSAFASYVEVFPVHGTAFEIACGHGGSAVWLAQRGLSVQACDISTVAIEMAQQLAELHDVQARCNFLVADLDQGLPSGASVDVVLCHMFRDRRLDAALIDRVRPGGLLAIACLSEVGASPGRFRAVAGELTTAFAELEVVEHDEGEGVAWLLARKPV